MNRPVQIFCLLAICLAISIPGQNALGYMFCEDNDYYWSDISQPDELGGHHFSKDSEEITKCGEEGRPPYCICNDNREGCGCYPGNLLWRYFPLNCPLRYGCDWYHGMHQCDDPGRNNMPLLPSDYFCVEDGNGHGQIQSSLPNPNYPPLCNTDADCPSGNWCDRLRRSGIASDELDRGECRPYTATGSPCDGECAPGDYCGYYGGEDICLNKQGAGDYCDFDGMCRSGQCVDHACVGLVTGSLEVSLVNPTVIQIAIISKRVFIPYAAIGVSPAHVRCDQETHACSFTHPQAGTRVEMQFDHEVTQNETGLVLSVPVASPVDTALVTGEEDTERGGLEAPVRIGSIRSRHMVAAIEADLLSATSDPVEVRTSGASTSEGETVPTLACYDVTWDDEGNISGEPAPRPNCLVFPDTTSPSTGTDSSSGTSGAGGGGGTGGAVSPPTITLPTSGSTATSRAVKTWEEIIAVLQRSSSDRPGENGAAPPSPSSRPMEEEVIDYVYDGMGRLIRRKTNGPLTLTGTRSWTWFGPNRLVEVSEWATLEFFHGSEGVEYLIQTVSRGADGSRVVNNYALHKDHLGSTTLLTDEGTGAVLYRYFYDPFGRPFVRREGVTASNIVFNPITYTGQYYDNGAGAYLFPFRAYDPQIGRFLQPDLLGYFDGPNLYSYVGNSPYAFVDPLGLASSDPRVRIHLFVATARSLDDIAPQLNRAASDMQRALGTGNTEIIQVSTGKEFSGQVNEIGERAKEEGVIHLIGVFSHSGSALFEFRSPGINIDLPGFTVSQPDIDLSFDLGSGLYFKSGQGFYTRLPSTRVKEGAATIQDLKSDTLPFLAFGLFGCHSKALGRALFEAGAAGYFGTDETAAFVDKRGHYLPSLDAVLPTKGPVHLIAASGEIGTRVRDPNNPASTSPRQVPYKMRASQVIGSIRDFIAQHVDLSPPKHQRNN